MATKTYTCIVCPQSCRITVEEQPDGTLKTTNAGCKRGDEFAANEHTNPMRMLTSTVKVAGGVLPRLPVVGAEEVPKNKLRDCLAEVYKVQVQAPVHVGDVIIKDVCGTGVDVVASRSLPAQ